jgi:hypothetical protein
MSNRNRRVKAIQLALTPRQTALMWIRKLANGTLEDGIRHSFPRRMIADSILKNVTNAMKGEPQALIVRAVCQARQEADMLYNLAISGNEQVLTSTPQRARECEFLVQYLRGITRINFGPHSEEEIRRTVLLFVEAVFLLDGSVSQVCAEHFGGNPILFSDSVERLANQLGRANAVLECFNSIADKLSFEHLTEKSIRETLEAAITRQCSIWRDMARVNTLAEFGDDADFRAAFLQFIQELRNGLNRHTGTSPLQTQSSHQAVSS